MKFHKVIGKIDPKVVQEAERKFSLVLLELGTHPNTSIVSKLGGNPLLFSLLQPAQHIATLNIPTAATDGRVFYWNPEFIASLDLIAIRFFCEHEPWHSLYLHLDRMVGKNKKLYNIAADFIVWKAVFDGLSKRNKNPTELFNKHIGKFITLQQTIDHFKDPSKPIPGFEDIDKTIVGELEELNLPKPDEDVELTEKQIKQIKKIFDQASYFYVDPSLPENMTPERIYNELMKVIPKCSKCGRLGVYKNPNNKKPHTHHQCKCDECCGDFDILGEGGTVDEHMVSDEPVDKIYKRFSDAARLAKSMGVGNIPGWLEDQLGELAKPKIRWQDLIRMHKAKIRNGSAKNDYSRIRSRPLAAGMILPKKISRTVDGVCFLDTSLSMSKDDMAFGVSQLQSLDDRAELTLVCVDTETYWNKAVKLRSFKKETLQNIKPYGRGGTVFSSVFDHYEQQLGKADFMIFITDGGVYEDMNKWKKPSCPVYWLITSEENFKPPFGYKFMLKN